MKLQRRHWLGNFAWRVEMTQQGTARDTKINIIEFEFPLCILLLCDIMQHITTVSVCDNNLHDRHLWKYDGGNKANKR